MIVTSLYLITNAISIGQPAEATVPEKSTAYQVVLLAKTHCPVFKGGWNFYTWFPQRAINNKPYIFKNYVQFIAVKQDDNTNSIKVYRLPKPYIPYGGAL